ncbi:hypothetical protein EDC01DRAFT_790796 [Geopyxis carbonaria]|nr:hypothetical protein EDC01DRAFT_790796 [Geopyxis carbonaria]
MDLGRRPRPQYPASMPGCLPAFLPTCPTTATALQLTPPSSSESVCAHRPAHLPACPPAHPRRLAGRYGPQSVPGFCQRGPRGRPVPRRGAASWRSAVLQPPAAVRTFGWVKALDTFSHPDTAPPPTPPPKLCS